MVYSGNDVEEITHVTCERETEKAILVNIEGRKTWVPKRVIHDDSEVWNEREDGRGPGKLIVARWFAEKEGLG